MYRTTADIIKQINPVKKKKYNILTFATHERYETQLAKTGHNFYVFHGDNLKRWDKKYAKVPDNYYPMPTNALYQGIDYDFILSQSKFGQYQMAALLNQHINVPLVSLEHTLPTTNLKDEWVQEIKTMVGNVNVFISEFSRDAWDVNSNNLEVVHHSVDSELFAPRSLERGDYVLSVVNDFANRDYCCNYEGWKRITEDIPKRLVGNNPGLSDPASSTDELVNEYNKCTVFLNTSTYSPIPTSLLEAMSCGTPVVSTATCMIPDIIENGSNGFISNDEEVLKKKIKLLLDNPDLAKEMGEKGRQTILEKFSEEKFLNNWNRIFDKVYEGKK
jgi:glycosyltransferase involved in cell wall biosynthesis